LIRLLLALEGFLRFDNNGLTLLDAYQEFLKRFHFLKVAISLRKKRNALTYKGVSYETNN